MNKYTTNIVIALAFIMGPISGFADDEDDVMDVIYRWAELEQDLEAQAALVRDDRVQIGGGVRQTNQSQNLEVQIMNYNAMVEAMGGAPEMIVRIESPLVRLYGDVAIASFVRLFNLVPPGERPQQVSAAWFSMVLVKENNSWKIAHHHVSRHGV